MYLFVSSFETYVIEKDDSQHAEAGLIGSTTKHQAGTILGQRFFCIEILHMSQISLGTIHWSFIFLRKRHTYLGGISLRIVVSTQKLSFSSFPQREKDSSIIWGALREQPAWKGEFVQATPLGNHLHLCCLGLGFIF